MITAADPLPDDLETAHQLIRELLETLGQQIHLNAKLQHQLEQLLRHRYSRKNERIAPAPPPHQERRPAPPRPPRGLRPSKPVLHDVPPEELPCPDCGTTRRRIGEE